MHTGVKEYIETFEEGGEVTRTIGSVGNPAQMYIIQKNRRRLYATVGDSERLYALAISRGLSTIALFGRCSRG